MAYDNKPFKKKFEKKKEVREERGPVHKCPLCNGYLSQRRDPSGIHWESCGSYSCNYDWQIDRNAWSK
jgi:hypothetical protein